MKMRSGAEVALRTWDPAKKDFTYTEAGKAFYKQRPRAYIVQVPVKIFVRRRNGFTESYFGTYPATDFAPALRERLNDVEGSTRGAQARIKREVLAHLGNNGHVPGHEGGGGVLGPNYLLQSRRRVDLRLYGG